MQPQHSAIRRGTKSIGAFPDGRSALRLVCAPLRFIEQAEGRQYTYLNMQYLEDYQPSDS